MLHRLLDQRRRRIREMNCRVGNVNRFVSGNAEKPTHTTQPDWCQRGTPLAHSHTQTRSPAKKNNSVVLCSHPIARESGTCPTLVRMFLPYSGRVGSTRFDQIDLVVCRHLIPHLLRRYVCAGGLPPRSAEPLNDMC